MFIFLLGTYWVHFDGFSGGGRQHGSEESPPPWERFFVVVSPVPLPKRHYSYQRSLSCPARYVIQKPLRSGQGPCVFGDVRSLLVVTSSPVSRGQVLAQIRPKVDHIRVSCLRPNFENRYRAKRTKTWYYNSYFEVIFGVPFGT